MGDIAADVRYAIRALLARRAFSIAVVLTLALALGMTTAIFSIVRGVLLAPLPVRDSDRLVSICELHPGANRDWCSVAAPNIEDIARSARSLDAIGIGRSWSVTLSTNEGAASIDAGIATPGMFHALGARAQLGRLIEAGDLLGAPSTVALLSDGMWRGRFGAARDIIGRSILLDGSPVTIVGVLEPSFAVPLFETAQLWRPVHIEPRSEQHRTWRGFVAYGRLRDGATIAEARAEVAATERTLRAEHFSTAETWALELRPLKDLVVGSVKQPLRVFFAAVVLVLLVACANVANLILARGATRSREFAVRTALGASRPRLLRAMLAECLVLSVVGATLGLLLAQWATAAFKALAPAGIPRLDQVSMNLTVIAFAGATALATALIFGTVPAIRLSRPNLATALRDGGRAATGRGRLGRMLVVAELAVALMLVTGAALLTRSFASLTSWNPRFERDHVAVFTMFVPSTAYAPGGRAVLADIWRRLEDEIGSIPGVTDVSTASAGPLFGSRETWEMLVEGRPEDERASIRWYDVGPDFFRTLGVPLVRGRDIAETDRFGAPNVGLVNETLARRFWPGQDPVGKQLTFPVGSQRETFDIVGVVADVPPLRAGVATEPELYWSNRQAPRPFTYFVVRTAVPPQSIANVVQDRVEAINGDFATQGFRTYAQLLGNQVRAPRFNMTLLLVFGATALLLAAVGTYGLLAYSVEQRRREIGIRMALGAPRQRVVTEVVRTGVALGAIGVTGGLVGSLVLGRLLSGLLTGVSAQDPATLAGSGAIVLSVVAIASTVPAWRASRVDPIVTLSAD